MMISMIKCPVRTLGPGTRIGVWTSGCHKRCKGCMSPHAWEFDETLDRSVDDLLAILRKMMAKQPITGITISGGEPFDQSDFLAFLKGVRTLGIEDVLVYTGYYKDEIQHFHDYDGLIGVLVDGPYEEAFNDNMPLRGSSNQGIYLFKPSLTERYMEFLSKPRSFDVELIGDVSVIIGLLPREEADKESPSLSMEQGD